jgi:hypothetical protein
VIFDGTLADAQICSDILARLPGEDQFHDLALSNGQARETYLCVGMQPEQPEEQFFFFPKHMAFCTLGGVTDVLQHWPIDCDFKCSVGN